MGVLLIFSPFFLFGIIPLIIGSYFYKKGKKYDYSSKVIEGEIIDVVEGIRVSDEPPGWRPVIRYWDNHTNSYLIYKSTVGGYFKSNYRIGDKIQLRYLYTDKGADVRINTPFAIYGVSKHFMVIGAIITTISIMILLTLLTLV